MTAMRVAVALLLGVSIGSFLNVLIHRVPRGISIVHPPSACPSCNTPVRPVDNVPVLSYLLLRGRCRACGASVGIRYAIVEAATAAFFVASVLRFEDVEVAVFVALAGAVLIALGFIDLEHRRLPNVIVLPALAAAAVWMLAYGALTGRWRVA